MINPYENHGGSEMKPTKKWWQRTSRLLGNGAFGFGFGWCFLEVAIVVVT